MPFRKRFMVELRQEPDYLPLALKRLLLQLSLQCAQL